MKLKRMVLVAMVILLTGVGALNAQVSFIDYFGVGGVYDFGESESNMDVPNNAEDSGGLLDNVHFIFDYLVGAYVQNIDSAIYLAVRTDFATTDVGLMWDYYFTNMAGFSLGAGVDPFGAKAYNNETKQYESTLVPYARVGAFLHFATMFKLGADFTYRLGGVSSFGVYVSVNSWSLLNRIRDYQPIRRTSNRDIIGRWVAGNTESGTDFYFGEDFDAEIVLYEEGSRDVGRGSWSTTDEGGNFGIQFIYANINGVITRFYYRVDLEQDTLWLSTDGESGITLNRYVE